MARLTHKFYTYGNACKKPLVTDKDVWNRLAAYEDTGLTPEEVEALKSERDRFKARAEAAETDITALARRAIDGFQDAKFITPCRWCAEREQCDLLTNGMNTCFKWLGPQEGANQ